MVKDRGSQGGEGGGGGNDGHNAVHVNNVRFVGGGIRTLCGTTVSRTARVCVDSALTAL